MSDDNLTTMTDDNIKGHVEPQTDLKVVAPNEVVEAEPLTWKFWKKRRYIVVLLAFFGFFNAFSLRINLSVAIVAMTENRTMVADNGTIYYEQDFPWDSKQKGLILSSFYYGYILTQFAGGYLASRIGGNLVFGIGIGGASILTLLTPLAANHSLTMLLTLRIVEGIFEGVSFPCIHAVWARWSPPLERSRMASIALAGTFAGTVVSLPLSGVFTTAYGWGSVFYIFGTIGVIWFVLWLIIVREGPEKDPYCSAEERDYIKKKLGTVGRTRAHHPWKDIFTSAAVYAIIASQFAESWTTVTLSTQLPTYLRDALNFNLDNTGFISAIPYLSTAMLLAFVGYLADWVQVKGYLTTTQVRRYFNCGALLGQTIFMMLTAYFPDPIWSVVNITIVVCFTAFALCGFAVNPLDIAPQHASVLMGISNTVATIPGMLSPLLTGYIVQEQSTHEWRIVFFIASGVCMVGAAIYWFFASGELQDWAKTPEQLSAKAEAKSTKGTKPLNGILNEAMELN